LLALLVFALPAGAEIPCGPAGVTASVSPRIAAPGRPFQVTLTNDSSQSIYLPSSCVYEAVFAGEWCEDPFVYAPVCLTVITEIAPGQSETMDWGQRDENGQRLPSGTYAFQISHDVGSCCPTVTISEGIPALSRWAVSGLVGCLCLAGIWAIRRRRAAGAAA
jgi:hypothetical protein